MNIWTLLKQRYVWRDKEGLIIPDSSKALTAFYGNIYAYKLDANDTISCMFHMPHDWVVGSDIYLHPHWGHNGSGLDGSDYQWTVYASYANRQASGGAIPAFSAEASKTIDIVAPSYAQYSHVVSETLLATSGGSGAGTGALLDTDSMGVDGLVLVTLKLSDEPVVTAGNTFVFTVDLHYQGRAYGTKQKDPDASYGYDY
jgi:hypothetical protein